MQQQQINAVQTTSVPLGSGGNLQQQQQINQQQQMYMQHMQQHQHMQNMRHN